MKTSVRQKRELPDVTRSEIWTVGRVAPNLDLLFIKVRNYCPCFVGTSIAMVDEDVLGTGVFHLFDNFG